MGYRLTDYERETIINMNDDEKFATVYTCQPTLIRNIDKLVAIGKATVIKQDEYSKTYELDRKFVKIKPPKVVSDSQRETGRKNMATLRAKQAQNRLQNDTIK